MFEYDIKLDVCFWADRNFRIKAKNAMDAEEKLLSMAKEYYSADLEEDFDKAITKNGYWSFGEMSFDVIYCERVDDKSEELEITAYEKGFLMSRAFQLRDESYKRLSKEGDDWCTVHVDSAVFSLNVWEDGEGVTRVTAYQDHLGENGYETDEKKFKSLL
jgi:hypothetical protein